MDLGQKLKQARLDAGLSQRQLCGDYISRNMLSLIENGSAKPSMDTLRYFAQMLGKPISFFLEEDAVASPNQAVMADARKAYAAGDPGCAMKALDNYCPGDSIFDFEYGLLRAICAMDLAEKAIGEGRPVYAENLLEKAQQAASVTPYCTQALQRRRLLLAFQAQPGSAVDTAQHMPDLSPELLLQAYACLSAKAYDRCLRLLDAASQKGTQWHFLWGEACFALTQYIQAADHYIQAMDFAPSKCISRLEQCYRELGDYKQAYFWACKQRDL